MTLPLHESRAREFDAGENEKASRSKRQEAEERLAETAEQREKKKTVKAGVNIQESISFCFCR
jgi:hypothetical protein